MAKDIVARALLGYSMFSRFIRNNLFRTTEGRMFFKKGDFFVKVHGNVDEAKYEYEVLQAITRANPQNFTVPRPLKLVDRTILMERVEGQELQSHIIRFLLLKNKPALSMLSFLGRALRELHRLNLKELRYSSLPTSDDELRREITRLAGRLSYTLDSTRVQRSIDERLFEIASLHGELYFSHIMVSDGRFVFLDFHRASKGPVFYDLVTFNVSLYSSLLLPARSPSSLDSLTRAFWKGYLGEEASVDSIRLMELYVLLTVLQDLLSKQHSLKSKLVNSQKIRKLESFLTE